MTPKDRIREHLDFLYGADQGKQIWKRLQLLLNEHRDVIDNNQKGSRELTKLNHRDAILITYGDQFREPNSLPLQTLGHFLRNNLTHIISGIHILPFYPSSSDDGFSVIDYRKIDPEFGIWDDITSVSDYFDLMLDAVINHVSSQSEWFQAFLRDEKPQNKFFIVFESPEVDLSQVVRPRALPLLTEVNTVNGKRYVWTTFSADQIDLDYSEPEVMLVIIELLLFYVAKGAKFIRLDAIAYLWKEIGTQCIHLPQTHTVVKLMRAILDEMAPWVQLITETNVPHNENISYFGELQHDTGRMDEAQIVYQFPLAPLTLHAFFTGDARVLSNWAASINSSMTFFNFIASHDGIGLMPAHGILTDSQIQDLIDQTMKHGGRVSYKTNQDGTLCVYELNITLFDWLNDPNEPDSDVKVLRFLASQAIMLSLAGVPGIYIHSLYGSSNCQKCVIESGRPRSINREKFHLRKLYLELDNPDSKQSKVFKGYSRMLRLRREHPAFHPNAPQRVLMLNKAIFCLRRDALDGGETVICLINVSCESQGIQINREIHNWDGTFFWYDILGDQEYLQKNDEMEIWLDGYQVLWMLAQK